MHTKSYSKFRLNLEDMAIVASLQILRLSMSFIPVNWCLRTFSLLGILVSKVNKRRVVALQNLKHAFGDTKSIDELKVIVRRCYQNILVSLAEFMLFDRYNETTLNKKIRVVNRDYLDSKLLEKNGVILLTGHLGNWEMPSLFAGRNGYSLSALIKDQKHPRSNRLLKKWRSRYGAKTVSRDYSMRRIIEDLRKGSMVGILADQHSGSKAATLDFLNRKAFFSTGFSRFAKKTHASVIPVFSRRIGLDNHEIIIGKDLTQGLDRKDNNFEFTLVQRFKEDLESFIRKYPEQWLWAHKRWKGSVSKSLLVVHDEKRGHTRQSEAFAQIVKSVDSKYVFKTHTIQVKYKNKLTLKTLSLLSILFRGRMPFGSFVAKLCLVNSCFKALQKVSADVVISCGSRTEYPAILCAKWNRARSCHIHKPSVSHKLYTAVLVPSHDKVNSKENNYYRMNRALAYFSPKELQESKNVLIKELNLSGNKRTIGLLVGGPTPLLEWTGGWLKDLVRYYVQTIVKNHWQGIVTTSRRTPGSDEAMIKMCSDKHLSDVKAVIANTFNPAWAYCGILALADVFIVTADSISMISECLSMSKSVIVVGPSDERKYKPKLKRFLHHLKLNKTIHWVTDKNSLEQVLENLSPLSGLSKAKLCKEEGVLKAAEEMLV